MTHFYKTLTVCTALIVTANMAQAQTPPRYSVTDLGTLGGPHGESEATAINDSGQVVGLCRMNDGDVPSYPFLWEKGQMRRIGHFQGTAYGINSQGGVVGVKYVEQDEQENSTAFVYSSHQVHLLKTLGGSEGTAKAINDASVVVGEASLKRRPDEDDADQHAVLWQDGQVYDLQKIDIVEANAINNRGEIAGSVPHGDDTLPVVLHGQTMKRLPLPKKFASATPNALNDGGEIVGGAGLNVRRNPDGSRPTHAAAWIFGRMYDLGLLNGKNSVANGVNSTGIIVGNAETKEEDPFGDPLTHAVVWQDRKMYDLNRCIRRHSGWELITASAINSRGQIVGSGYHNHITRAFLLTPITK